MSKIYTLNNIIYLILFLGLIYTYFNCSAEETTSDTITSSVLTPAKVIDGDSLEIGSHRIRLMGIDAPEYIQKCKNKNKKSYPCGKKSAQYLQNLIKNHNLTCRIIKKDQYDRDLCTCYADDKNINKEMVLSGNAIIYLESPYKEEQDQAKQHKRGLWQGRFMQPRLFRRLKEQEKAN